MQLPKRQFCVVAIAIVLFSQNSGTTGLAFAKDSGSSALLLPHHVDLGPGMPTTEMSLVFRPDAGAVAKAVEPDEDLPKLQSSTPAQATPGYTTILFEDAESSFPATNNWNVFDSNAASGQDYWDDLTCRSYNGSWSVWSADIGDQSNCVNYDNNMESWMIFGPFSLADATAARAEFRAWSETERPDIPFDYFFWGASANGTNFSGFRLTADANWGLGQLDFTSVPTLGDLTGDSSVWFAFAFFSDSTVNSFEGTYVDDILIEKLVPSQVDLDATEVFFRDQPGNAGNVVDNPTPSDTLYPHFTYTINGTSSVSGKIWEIELNSATRCSLTETQGPGSWVGWCTSPVSLLPGLHSLHGELDPNQTISETNENNNDDFHNYNVDGDPGAFSLSNEPPVCDTQPPGPSPAVRLNWTTSAGATSYDVYRNGSFYAGGNTGNTFYNSANVLAGQTYSYFIRAINGSGDRDSNTINVPIPSDICEADIRIEPLTLNFDSESLTAAFTVTDRNEIRLKRRSFVPDAKSTAIGDFSKPRKLLIQFEDTDYRAAIDELTIKGVTILHWVPRNAVLAHVPAFVDPVVPGVRWSGPLLKTDKISARIDSSTRYFVVDFLPDTTERGADAAVGAAGGTLVPNPYLRPKSFLFKGDSDVAWRLAGKEEASWVRAASRAEASGEELFHCPGGLHAIASVGEFAAANDGWDGPGQGSANDLTYQFDNGTADIAGSQEQGEVERAYSEWENHAAVSYTETNTGGQNRSMDIAWATGDHGDGFPFDGPNGTLAHNFFPVPTFPETIAGDMHFDDAETWRIGAGSGYDLFTVALHEAGHGLGLAHSDVSDAVMFPSISSSTIFTALNADDIAGIQSIYAAPAGGGESFTVFNDGVGTLDVTSIAPNSSSPWISWAPGAPFSVPPGGSRQVDVMVNFAAAPAGQSNRRLLVQSNDANESPYPGGVNIVVDNLVCYSLSRSHTGSGTDPVASPSSSTGCSNGQYQPGENVSLSASPSSGWQVQSWSGTNNDASTSTSNSLVMPGGSHTVSVHYTQTTQPCYLLTRSHTGMGGDPSASPGSSSGCTAGRYHAGQAISLTAASASGWQVGSWSGTSNDGSTSTSNSLVMPSGPHTASVNYVESSGIPQNLVLSNDTLSTSTAYEACDTITLGPSLVVAAGAPGVIFRAPTIRFVSGVVVTTSAVAQFDSALPAGCI